MKQTKYKEKQIVDYIIKNWSSLMFKDMQFFRREKEWLPGWRNDITAVVPMTLGEEYGYKTPHTAFKMPVFIEVKYNSESRDLIYELTKALTAVSRFKNTATKDKLPHPAQVGVISDNFSDPYIYDFIVQNNIHMWQIQITDDDINTMKLNYIDYTNEEIACTYDKNL